MDRDRSEIESPDADSAADVVPPEVAPPEIAPPQLEPARAEASHRSPLEDARHGLALTTLLCAAVAAFWIGTVARCAGHGFDASDEGYYLLSYRWWHTNFRNFTGAQYLYGPVFQTLGYSIAGLRLFRLFTHVAVFAVLGFTFMRWLRERRPNAPATRLWEAAGCAAVVASGGAAYGWLPLSPGYNDVSLLGSLLGSAVALRAATYVERGVSVPKWVPISFGPVIVCSLFAKWSSSVISVSVVAATLVVVLAPRGWRELARFAAWTLASIVMTVAVIHVFVVPLGTALPPMMAVNRRVASQTNAVGPLLKMYWATGSDLLSRIAKREALLAAAGAVAVLGRRPLAQRCASFLGVAGFAYAYAELDAHHGTTGGNQGLTEYPAGLLGSIAIAVLIGALIIVVERLSRVKALKLSPLETSSINRDGLRGWAVLAMLALAPVTQALGTGNPLYFTAINGFAAWTPIVIAVLTGIEAAPDMARWLTTGAAAAGILLSASVGTSAVSEHPYRTLGRAQATDVVGGVPALASVRLGPNEAAGFSRMRSSLQRYVEPPGRAMMAWEEMAGVILVLDGRPVGESWYSATDRIRSAAGIKAECEGGKPFWGARLPLLAFRRPISATEIDALESCGLSFARDYRVAGPAQMGVTFYVPVREDTNEAAKDPQ